MRFLIFYNYVVMKKKGNYTYLKMKMISGTFYLPLLYLEKLREILRGIHSIRCLLLCIYVYMYGE